MVKLTLRSNLNAIFKMFCEAYLPATSLWHDYPFGRVQVQNSAATATKNLQTFEASIAKTSDCLLKLSTIIVKKVSC